MKLIAKNEAPYYPLWWKLVDGPIQVLNGLVDCIVGPFGFYCSIYSTWVFWKVLEDEKSGDDSGHYPY